MIDDLAKWYQNAVLKVANAAISLLPAELRRQMAGVGRFTVPSNANPLSWFNWLPRRHQKAHNIDLTKLQSYTAGELLEMLISVNPDVSQAMNTFLRMSGTQLTFTANTKRGELDEEGQRVVDDLIDMLNEPIPTPGYQHGRSLDKLDGIQRMMTMLRGACAGEVVLNDAASDVVDIAPVDPFLVWFRRDPDTNRLIPYQYVEMPVRRDGEDWYGQYKKIDTPLFIFEELDPMVDDPYGREPLLPVLQVVFFYLQVLADLKAVIHNQGYPRIVVSVVEEIMLKNMPAQFSKDPNKQREWLNARMSELFDQFKNLNPDDALIGWDSIKYDYIKGSGNSAMIDVKKLIDVLDAQMAAATKSLLTLLGRHQGSTETYSSVEVKLYIKSAESVREVARRFWERALTMAARVKGVQTRVDAEYTPIDLRSEQEQEKDRQARLANLSTAESSYYITPEEAAREARLTLGFDPNIPDELKQKLKEKQARRESPPVDTNSADLPEGGENEDATD